MKGRRDNETIFYIIVVNVSLYFCVKNIIHTGFFKKTDHEVVWNFLSRVQIHYIIQLVYIANFLDNIGS